MPGARSALRCRPVCPPAAVNNGFEAKFAENQFGDKPVDKSLLPAAVVTKPDFVPARAAPTTDSSNTPPLVADLWPNSSSASNSSIGGPTPYKSSWSPRLVYIDRVHSMDRLKADTKLGESPAIEGVPTGARWVLLKWVAPKDAMLAVYRARCGGRAVGTVAFTFGADCVGRAIPVHVHWLTTDPEQVMYAPAILNSFALDPPGVAYGRVVACHVWARGRWLPGWDAEEVDAALARAGLASLAGGGRLNPRSTQHALLTRMGFRETGARKSAKAAPLGPEQPGVGVLVCMAAERIGRDPALYYPPDLGRGGGLPLDEQSAAPVLAARESLEMVRETVKVPPRVFCVCKKSGGRFTVRSVRTRTPPGVERRQQARRRQARQRQARRQQARRRQA